MDEEIKNMKDQKDNPNFEEAKHKAEEKLLKFQNDMMVLGVRIGSRYINNVISEFKKSPGKKSTNDYKRLIKKIEDFCNRSLTKDELSEESSTEETIQN